MLRATKGLIEREREKLGGKNHLTQSENVRVDFTEELTLDEMPGDQVEIRHRRAENIRHIRGCSTVLQTAGGGAGDLLKKMKQVLCSWSP